MQTVTQVADAMQYVLTERANELGRETGFIKRKRQLTGATFCQALVFGWMAASDGSMETLSQSAANVDVKITRQGLQERFTPEAAAFLRAVLEESVRQVIRTKGVATPVLSRFDQVRIMDSTTVTLPDELAMVWAGCEGSAVKISLDWDLRQGTLHALQLHAAREHDQQAPLAQAPLPPDTLRLADLGYFKLDRLQMLADDQAFWVTRYKQRTAIYDEAGHRVDLVERLRAHTGPILDLPIHLGTAHRIPCRLLAQRVPDAVLQQRQDRLRRWESDKQRQASPQRWALLAWTLYVTNAPSDLLSADEVLAIGTVRWQIELLFRLWKTELEIDEWRTVNVWRMLCELYAKLIACIIQHWLMLVGEVHDLSRSLTQACHTIQAKAWQLAEFLTNRQLLIRTIRKIGCILRAGCRISSSSSSPPTWQLFEP
jgi:hypothetical protein